MTIKLTFLGAAKNVTGSSYLLECYDKKYLIDCGLYQERDLKGRNWDQFPLPPESIDGVLLTHAHLDHCGRLPKIVKEGFNGKIYCTAATADIAQIILLDSAKIQEEDANNKKFRHEKEGKKAKYPEEPLYTISDVHRTLPLFTNVDYERPVQLSDRVKAIFYNAGHILGSSSIKVIVQDTNGEKSILFSGDVGRWDIPILKDPAPIDSANYVLVESTYGDREHGKIDNIKDNLANIINEAYNSKGNIVIPSFAVERTQELLYYLGELRAEKKIPHLLAFVD
ncbi:MAG: MBL fold metallo-hydrolase, partial [Euryarchaeota archaeon]|nr:MBL fold metallo-hydrolase [Euryarchaeota archaeon]